MNTCQSAKNSHSKCLTQQTLKSSQSISSHTITKPFTIFQKTNIPSFQRSNSNRKKIFNNRNRDITKRSDLKQTRSISNGGIKILRGEILGGINQLELKNRKGSIKKRLPQDMKIIYYGPIGKSPVKIKNDGKLDMLKNNPKIQQIQIVQPKQIEVNSIIEKLQTKSRYYDINSTKISEIGENKKMSVTFYPIRKQNEQNKGQQKNKINNRQVLLYILLGLIGVILLFKVIIS